MTASAAIPSLRAAQALSAYRSTDSGGAGSGGAVQPPGQDFASLLTQSLGGAIDAGQQAEAQSLQAISGHADVTKVVAAVSRAQLALQTTVAVRDRVLQAYQDVIKMPI